MFSLHPSRKRRRQTSGSFSNDGAGFDKKPPLHGTVICLTGLSQEEKERLHCLVEELGGQFTRDLNSNNNTHLIANVLEGPKCEAAAEFDHIHIVKPAWLEACSKQMQRVDETPFSLTRRSPRVEDRPGLDSLEDALDNRISREVDFSLQNDNFLLFSGCQFYLAGFEPDSREEVLLGRLIRRSMGTIHWELQDTVSHVIINDEADGTMGEATLLMETIPYLVSPWWVMASLDEGQLAQCSSFPPRYRTKSSKKLSKTSDANDKNVQPKQTNVFRGCLFALIRVAPPEWAVDFSPQKLEDTVVAHGGQLLSLKLVEALRADQIAGRLDSAQLRKCYVVCWGSYTPGNLIHPLVSQVKRDKLCNVIEVTPIWLQTCVVEKKCLVPTRLAECFVPSHFPLHAALCVQKTQKEKPSARETIRISVSGFSGFKRTALIQLIEAMGGNYDDSMRTSTTHLVCRQSTGEKYEKALEWKLHVVSEDWLYHVSRYGFSGKDGANGQGCEKHFSLETSSRPPKEAPSL